MICVTIEIREGALTRRARVTAPSIERALKIAGGGKRPEMERVSVPCTNDTVPPPEGDGATRLRRDSTASRGQGEEAPELLAGYLERIGRSPLLTPREEAELARRARAGDEKAFRALIEKNLRLVVS